MLHGGNYSYGSHSGYFALVKNPPAYGKIEARYSCEHPGFKYTAKDIIGIFFLSILSMLEIMIKGVLFSVLFPIVLIYLMSRLGFKKTVKLFKRIDRENKRKRMYL